jgi:crossover junction endodeoxyribonuclease RuvC
MKYFLGIDPGQEGAFVLLHPKLGIICHKKMPIIKLKNKNKVNVHYDTLNIISFLETVKFTYEEVHVFIEEISAAPGQGVTSMFSMGYGFGLLVGILSCIGLPHTRVRPNIWKAALLKGLPKEKMASCVVATRLFPKAQEILALPRGGLDHNIADALLIAEWGRQSSLS